MLLHEILDILDNDTRVTVSMNSQGLRFETSSYPETILKEADDELLNRPIRKMYVLPNVDRLHISV